jgi:leucyl aminopeptidase
MDSHPLGMNSGAEIQDSRQLVAISLLTNRKQRVEFRDQSLEFALKVCQGSLNSALEISGEKIWRLPLGDEYYEQIRSDIADIKNTGGRWGGASTAAQFLQVFADETPWIHLDIAGMAWYEDTKPFIAKGPSGFGVRSILEWVRSYEQ